MQAGDAARALVEADCLADDATVERFVYVAELVATRGEPFGYWGGARAAEGRRCPESDVVDQDDQDVGRTVRWKQRLDRRERRVRVLGVIGDVAGDVGVVGLRPAA